MKDLPSKKRTTAYKWHSKQELYTFFDEIYGLKKAHVDKEILTVRESFKIRKNQTIHTAELWEKVGRNLEKKFG